MRHIFFQRFYSVCIGLILVGLNGGICSDNNILWDYLYHNDPANYNPTQEFVPFESYTFRSVDVSGHVYPFTAVIIYILVDFKDLTSANVVYSTGGSDTFIPMSWVKNVTTSFHGQTSRKYDLYSATIPPQPAGTTVWYRIQVNDGSASAYLKTNNTYRNPLGQWVRTPDAPAWDNYSYVVENAPIAVELLHFAATLQQDKVLLSWITQSEVDLAGFYIVRSNKQCSDFKRINDILIRAAGSPHQGAAYHFVDSTRAQGTYYYQLEIVKLNGASEMSEMVSTATATAIERDNRPTHLVLLQNYPNPFNHATTIRYVLSQDSDIQLVIYNTNGHLVRYLLNERKPAGTHIVMWDGRDATGAGVSSGVYFCQIVMGEDSQIRKMTLLE